MRPRHSGIRLAGLAIALVAAVAVVASAAAETPPPAAGVLLPPEAPTGVRAVAGDGRATVSWTAPADGGSPITHYTVTATPAGPVITVDGRTTTTVVEGLANGTAYTFTVTAVTLAGSSPPSAPSRPVTPAAGLARAEREEAPGLAPDADRAGLAPAALEGLHPARPPEPPPAQRAPAAPEPLPAAAPAPTPAVAPVAAGPVVTGGVTVTPVGAPSLVRGTPGDGQVTVRWVPAPAGQRLVLAWVARATPGGRTVVVDGGVTQAVVDGLVNGQAYTFTVHALTPAGPGPVSEPSAPVVPWSAP